jgi:hypothetical protein
MDKNQSPVGYSRQGGSLGGCMWSAKEMKAREIFVQTQGGIPLAIARRTSTAANHKSGGSNHPTIQVKLRLNHVGDNYGTEEANSQQPSRRHRSH